MGIAVRHKLDKVVVPFIDKGIPIEYELVRSISTVAQKKRKRIAVLRTAVPLFQSQNLPEDSELVKELKKQYDVVQVEATELRDIGLPTDSESGTEGKRAFDVLLAVQPSTLSATEMI